MEQLTPREVGDLRALEVRIEEGKQAFEQVGLALLEIRDRKLYRQSHSSFQNYCRDRWQFTGRRAYQMVEAAAVVQSIKDANDETVNNCSQFPTTESQCRPLSVVEPAQRAEVFQKAVQKAKSENKPVTARRVEAAVNEHIEKPEVVRVVAESKDSEELAELKQAWLLAGREDREAFKLWANI